MEKEFGEIFSISKEETTSIDNGFLKIIFLAHGHELNEPGQVSPLIIHLEFEFENKKHEKTYNIWMGKYHSFGDGINSYL